MDKLRPEFKLPLLISFIIFISMLVIKDMHLLDILGRTIDFVGMASFCFMIFFLFAYVNVGYHMRNN